MEEVPGARGHLRPSDGRRALHLPTGYAVRVAYPLTRGPDRVAGRLELLEDARIRPAMRSAIAEAYGADPCADHPAVVLQPICGVAGRPARLLPALLRLLDDRDT